MTNITPPPPCILLSMYKIVRGIGSSATGQSYLDLGVITKPKRQEKT
jgi:hypothetical protein